MLLYSQEEKKRFKLEKFLKEVKAYEESLLKCTEEDIRNLTKSELMKEFNSLLQDRTRQATSDDVVPETSEELNPLDRQLKEEILDGLNLTISDGEESLCKFDKQKKTTNDNSHSEKRLTFVENCNRSDYHVKLKYLEDMLTSVKSDTADECT